MQMHAIQPVKSVRALGIQLDSEVELAIRTHVSKVASSCFYQLRHLQQIRRLVGQEVTAKVVAAFILSWLDYCNSVLTSLPQSTICTTAHSECGGTASLQPPSQRPHNASTPAATLVDSRIQDHI